jgi:hypothetical protein
MPLGSTDFLLFFSVLGLSGITIVEEKQCDDTEPEMNFQELPDILVCVEEFYNGALPPLWRRKVEETEYDNLNNENPEKERIYKFNHIYYYNLKSYI